MWEPEHQEIDLREFSRKVPMTVCEGDDGYAAPLSFEAEESKNSIRNRRETDSDEDSSEENSSEKCSSSEENSSEECSSEEN